MNTITFVTGGIRSGKSRFALDLAEQRFSGPKVFLATAQPLDEEMKRRIAKHQAERAGEFLTLEEPLYLAKAVKEAAQHAPLILIDCLTLWVNNLIYHFGRDNLKIKNEIRLFMEVLETKPSSIILVSNETGWGIVGENPLNRHFVDQLGALNQEAAGLSDEVILMVSGIPQTLKECENHAKLDRSF
ncbi:MAG: bifunctional adenosylcobinamide kinase/adenosylcobinamide-phosphate guanylyltransferase [Candidatus Omnitrophica bacterium]|nr:bifunctional adenosylcobinamide kinase/adenosylcobinamide-phosphate guanylyltransferase [Candidatus Omnitrophota bacterium]